MFQNPRIKYSFEDLDNIYAASLFENETVDPSLNINRLLKAFLVVTFPK